MVKNVHRPRYSSVVVSGSVGYDEIMNFPGKFVDHFHPEFLHQINVSFVVDRLERQLGGIATNIAYNMAHTSTVPVKIASAIGSDGDSLIAFFQKNNIDISLILRDETRYCASGKVMTDITDNQIWGYYYGALECSKDINFQQLIGTNALLILSPTHVDGFIHAHERALQYEIPYAYDPGMALTWISDDILKKGIEHAQYLVGNDYEIAQIFRRLKTSEAEIVARGTAIITTLAERGVRYRSAFESMEVPAFGACRVVDPTGAGDAFRGGFFGALAEGKSIRESLTRGNAVASFAVESYGTVNHQLSKHSVYSRQKTL